MAIETREIHRDEASARRLTVRYIFALSTVAALSIAGQCLVQFQLWSQARDSRVVNLAERQRMLSQRLTKNVLALYNADTPGSREDRLLELRSVLSEWEGAHRALQTGDTALGVNGNNSETVVAMFAAIDEAFHRMADVARGVLEGAEGEPLHPLLAQLLEDERAFLSGMDALVFQYDDEARARLDTLRAIELVLLATTLLVLIAEGFLIFRPAARRIQHDFGRLRAAGRRNRAVALELEAVFDATPALVWYQDAGGRILRINRVAAEALGGAAESLIHRSTYSLFGEHGAAMRQEDEALMAAGSGIVQAQLEFESPRGRRRIRMNKVPFHDNQGTPVGVIAMAEDVTGYDRLERALVNLKAEEQRRIGQDLHDGLGQLLTGALYLSKRVENRARKDLPELVGQVEEIAELVKDGIKSVRDISKVLCPLDLTPDSLVGALRKLVEQSEKVTGIECEFVDDCRPFAIGEDVTEHIYRISQEALNNAMRHSGATRIVVGLRTESGELILTVEDNGIGMMETQSWEDGGMGLRIMKRRAELCRAALHVKRTNGTMVTCRVCADVETMALI